MNYRIGLIFTAGNQTRFYGKNKCLMKYNQLMTILLKNILTLGEYVHTLYLVLNKNNDNRLIEDVIKKMIRKYHYLPSHPHIIYILSGHGNGHAIRLAIKWLNINYKKHYLTSDYIVMWGDAIHDKTLLLNDMCYNFNGYFTIPLKYEKKCYVKFIINKKHKYIKLIYKPNKVEDGYHDFSLFMMNGLFIFNILDKYYKDNLNILKLFDFMECLNSIANYIRLPYYLIKSNKLTSNNSFNTIEEYNEVINHWRF